MLSAEFYEKVSKKRFKLAFVGCLFLYAILNLIFCSMAQNSLKSDTTILLDISNNWQTKAIKNIRVDSTCPKGYEQFTGYTWPGTSEGCWCGDISIKSKRDYDIDDDLFEGSCNTRQQRAGCKGIDAMPPRNFSTWGFVQSSSKKICIERSRDSWAEVAMDSGEKCANSRMTKCGKSANNVYCTQESQCPINDIRVVDIKNPTGLTSCLTENYCVVLSQDWLSMKVLQYKRADTHDALPIAQLSMNENGMCQDSSQKNISPNREEFPLLNSHREHCSAEEGRTWNLTNTVTETELFEANGLGSSIKYLYKYGYYSDSESGDDYKWGLYTRSFIPWYAHCRDKMEDFIDYSENLQVLNVYQALQMGVAYITGWTLGIVLPFYLLLQIFQGDKTVLWIKPPRTKEERTQAKEFARNWNVLFMFMAVPFTLLALIASAKANMFFQSVIERNCSDSKTLLLIHDLSKSLDDVYEDNIISFFLLIGIIVISFVFHRYQNWKRTQRINKPDTHEGKGTERLLEMKEVNNFPMPESLDEEEKRNSTGRSGDNQNGPGGVKYNFYPVSGIMATPYHQTSQERTEVQQGNRGIELHEYDRIKD